MNQLWRSEYSLTHTTRGSVCALSNKVLDVIAEFTFHTDLFNCWTCLLDLQINGDIKVRHIMYMCITVSARKCGILTKLVLSLHNARYAEWHINYITWPQSHEVLEVWHKLQVTSQLRKGSFYVSDKYIYFSSFWTNIPTIVITLSCSTWLLRKKQVIYLWHIHTSTHLERWQSNSKSDWKHSFYFLHCAKRQRKCVPWTSHFQRCYRANFLRRREHAQ